MADQPEPHGLYYVTRDGTRYDLDRYLVLNDEPIPRPERDVLAALLRFCLEGLKHMDARERVTP